MGKETDNYEFSRAALDAAPIGVTIFDENLHVIECNETILDLLGATKQYYIEHFFKLNPKTQPNGDNSKEKAFEVIKRVLNGENLTFEWTHISTSGELIPFEITLTRTKYKGKLVGLAYLYDLRHIRKITEELENQSKQLKTRLEQQELISEISRSFVSSVETQTLVNEAIAKIGRYHKVSVVAIFKLDYQSNNAHLAYHWSADLMQPPVEKIKLNEMLKSSFPERLYDSSTMPVLSCTDTEISKIEAFQLFLSNHVSAFVFAPLYVEGRLWGMLTVQQCLKSRQWTDNEKSFIAMTASTIANAIMLDIYDSKLNEAFEKVTAASKAKSEFLSNMSHEMRTPMNAIINMTVIAKRTEDIERKNYALDKIGDASTHLLGVINDILDMSKIEAKKFELAPVEFNFEKMLARVLNVVNFRIEEKCQTLILNVDKEIPKMLIGDEQRLSQVITNLLGNAVKFTPENGSVKVDTHFLEEKNGVCTLQISVIDSGIGINKEHLKRLFQSFHQAESSTARKYGGTGLGLSISKSIVEMMGGEIWVDSEPGKGSTFAFTIQVQRGTENAENQLEKNTDKEGDDDFTGHRILLVEDVDINREIVLTLLEPTHLEIDCAENGLQAVEMYIEEPDRYEMILMDIQMPGMDGFEATVQIRAFEEKIMMETKMRKRIPIIAMTANVFREDIENCINAGMDDHIGKPLDIEVVMEKLRIYLTA
ncbi:MAG: ATP-binding protein [Treponema sp.]|nr:ATP-binding protein [Treponema sp.]